MRILAAAILTVGALAASAGAAFAGTYDGDWIGQVPPTGSCNSQSVIDVTVANDTLMGQIHNPGNVLGIAGKIDADGNATFAVLSTRYTGTMKFTVNHFEGDWFNGGCNRHVLGDRAPDADQSAAMLAKRKQAQAVYSDLSARAVAGDRDVDFTALRAAYPFTAEWDVFGNKTGPLMNQAIAAAKGGDCPAAMEKLEEVLKIDFTIAQAHRLRGSCLDGGAAQTEDFIAGKLEDSITRTGDGYSEKTAYTAMTMQEENDVLGHERLMARTRDLQIRGSDGNFYDVVHASTRLDTPDIRPVYFDVTAQVEGRTSRWVLAKIVNASLP